MNHLPTGLSTSLATLTLLAGALFLAVTPMAGAADAAPPIRFGMESSSVSLQSAAGVKPDYGTFWIGPWTLTSGWAGPDNQLAAMKNAGVTPAVHFYYWGDDISPSCVENGCWSSLHDSQKTRAGWNTLATQMTDHLKAKMGGAPVVVFLESEFNKGGIETYEPYDGYLEAMAKKIHAAYPNAIIVLGFGNWGSNNWGTFDRAAAASDMVGIQGMRGSTKQTKEGMLNLYEGLTAGVKTLGAKFPGKPIMLTDLAVSSYPEPEYLAVQRDVMKEVLDNRATLKSLGVEAIIYRSWKDSPSMDLANYYGEAERHWGVAWAGNGTLKPVAKVWVDAVKAERAGVSPPASTTTTTTTAPSGTYTATVTPSSSSNAWWIQVGVSPAPTLVEAKVGSGSFVALDKQSYGWAKSLNAPAGTMVQFRVTSSGQTATTPAQAWLVDMSPKTATASTASTTTTTAATTTTTAASATTTSSAATATVTPVGNEWWVQAGVSSAKPLAGVQAKAGSGPWVALQQQSYGWAASFHVPSGTPLQFRLTATDGQTATTAPQAWLVDMSAKSATWVAPTSSTSTSATASPTTSTAPPASTTSSMTSTAPPASTTSSTSSTTAPPTSPTTSTAPPPTSTSSTTSTAPVTNTTTSAAVFKATFTPKGVGIDWWVETAVSANEPIAKVEAKVKGGGWVLLQPTGAGTYAASVHAPDGTAVTFRATSLGGATSSSARIIWT